MFPSRCWIVPLVDSFRPGLDGLFEGDASLRIGGDLCQRSFGAFLWSAPRRFLDGRRDLLKSVIAPKRRNHARTVPLGRLGGCTEDDVCLYELAIAQLFDEIFSRPHIRARVAFPYLVSLDVTKH